MYHEAERIIRICMKTIPEAPPVANVTDKGSGIFTIECKEKKRSTLFTFSAELRIPASATPRTGFATCIIAIGEQRWIFRMIRANEHIFALSVSGEVGKPHYLDACWYEGAERGSCTLCGKKDTIVTYGEHCGMLPHIRRCDACQPLPCGEPTASFNKELALSL